MMAENKYLSIGIVKHKTYRYTNSYTTYIPLHDIKCTLVYTTI